MTKKRQIGSRPPLVWFLLTGVFLATGCGGGGDRLYPVSGKVTLNNQPLTFGIVNFFPEAAAAKGEKQRAIPVGKIEPDGSYTLSTDGKSGAPAGKYKVVVNTMVPPTGDAKVVKATPVNQKYTTPDSPLRVEVVASPSPGAYDLKLTP